MTMPNVSAVLTARHQPGGHRERGGRAEPEQRDVDGPGQLRVPARVGLVERIAVDPTVTRRLEERTEVQERHQPGRDPQQREGAQADPAAEQLVDPVPRHRASSRSTLRRTTVFGSCALRQ